MIGIVVVSHSRALADAAVALAGEMVEEETRPAIKVAAGLDESTFGTDASAVAEAITAVDSPDGVLVLLDLGSAVLSAEMALEFVEPDMAKRVVLSSAPLVEGLVAAVVTASTGATLDSVVDEARAGLTGKQEHLSSEAPASEASVSEASGPSSLGPDVERVIGGESNSLGSGDDARSVELEVNNEHGLHARPAARLVALVRDFDAQVSVTNLRSGKGPVDARSLAKVATLDARRGDRVRVSARGSQADAVLAAVAGLAGRNWGDSSTGPPLQVDAAGAAVGSGLDAAIGAAVVTDDEVDVTGYSPGEAASEQRRSDSALATALEQIDALEQRSAAAAGADAGAIFAAQRAMLDDPDLHDDVRRDIAAGASAVEAWTERLSEIAMAFESLPDAYQRERAQDVRSLLRRVLGALVGTGPEDSASSVGILVVAELDASTAASVDAESVVGILTQAGGATGHGPIVARSRGIPIITDLGSRAASIRPGALVAFDARSGRVEVDPDDEVQAEFRALIESRASERRTAMAAAAKPAETTDGCRVLVKANVTSVEDARAAANQGAEGSGLVRTEILFGGCRSAPSVDEQVAAFRDLSEALYGRPVTIRTWDVGGDKPLSFMPHPSEANPFLGERGLRLSRREPAALLDQLRAICQVAREHPVQVMFPMVTTAEEVAWARARLDEAAPDTDGRARADLPELKVGIMIEVPAAALRVRHVAAGVDFVSIGTNDLAQYTAAAERGNAAVAGLADGCDPAVLELILRVCSDVPAGTDVAVCGDLASDPATAVLLVGLGVRELSVVGAQVPLVKARIREVSLADAADLAERALACGSAGEVRALLAG